MSRGGVAPPMQAVRCIVVWTGACGDGIARILLLSRMCGFQWSTMECRSSRYKDRAVVGLSWPLSSDLD